MRRREKVCSGLLGALGLITLVAGILIIALLPMLVRQLVEKQVALKDGSFAEETWRLPPFNISMQFWIFNVTNPEDVLEKGVKPVLVQKGPYGYREKQWKENIQFSDERDSVSYLNRKVYFFDPTLSCQDCSGTDKFVVPNIPYLTVLKMIRDKIPGFSLPTRFIQWMLTTIGEHPFAYNIQAKQLLFEGYSDKVFDLLNLIKKGSVPDRMGLFYGKNASNDGLYEIRSGIKDAMAVGQLVKWNNHSDLLWTGWWRPDFLLSNMLNGSDGTVYPPFIKRTDSLPIFVSDICRSVYVTYKADVDHQGLAAYRFSIPSEVFEEDTPANRGFCWPSQEKYYEQQPRDGNGWCLPSGLLDVSKCQNGAPVVVSSPHFLFCPDEVKQSVVGLDQPRDDVDNTVLDLEPTTGIVLAGARKIQLNVAMYNDLGKANYRAFNHMKSVIVPIVMINESVTIDDHTRQYVYDNVVVTQRNVHIGAYVALGLGALLCVLVVAFIAYRCVQDKRNREADGRWATLEEPSTVSVE